MKKLIWSVLFLTIYTTSSAQIEERAKAIQQFNLTQYASSIQNWLKIEKSGKGDLESKLQLAEAYYQQKNYNSALEWMLKASQVNELSEYYQIHLAELYKITGNTTAADSIFSRYGNKYQNKLSRASKYIQAANYDVYSIANINTSGDEFSPSYYRDGIVFIGNAKSKKSKYSWNNRPWLNILQIPFKPTGKEKLEAQVLKLPKVNKFHSGPVTFTSQYNRIYFSHSQNKIKKSKSNSNTIGIFSAVKRDNKWTELKAFEFNHPEYSVAHPTIGNNGKDLFFVSDKPGGIGGTDIYYSRFTNGKWTAPINLGTNINTTANELFPFIHEDGTLYFASEGHTGFGGLDIFYSTYENGVWNKPTNIGATINSSYDDFGLILDKNKNNGYFSSNRPGGAGNDDIYRIVLNNNIVTKIAETKFTGKIQDKSTLEALPKSTVRILNQDKDIFETQTDNNGNFELIVQGNPDNLSLSVFHKGYFPLDTQVSLSATNSAGKLVLQKIEINKSIVVPNIYYEFDKADITPQADKALTRLYNLLIDNPTWIIEIGAHTDSRADATYNQTLSEKRAINVVKFLTDKGINASRLYAKGYGEKVLLNKCKDGVVCSEEEHAINRRTEFKLIGFLQDIQEKSTPIIFADEYVAKNNLVYKIQIGVFKVPDQKWLQTISDLGNIEMIPEKNKDFVKVYIYSYPSYEAAKKFLDTVYQRGIKDAFIVPFYKGKAISIEEAKKLTK
ncbi:MAG: OmpA family protein [Chitinophagales bacterium]|nr:OmpA family protein [Chitinophagales bacterium]